MAKLTAEDTLTLKYVPLKTIRRWSKNTKRHDIDLIIKSLVKHGFKDPLKYEPALNKGAGGIVEGNGRDEALIKMYEKDPRKPPRGIVMGLDDWMVPVLFGVDAKSEAAAEAYGYDHNNITVAGAGGDLSDIMRMYEDNTAQLLQQLDAGGQMPVSVNADDLDALLDAEREQLKERQADVMPKTMLRILISVPAALALDVQEHIDALREIQGVEIDISGN